MNTLRQAVREYLTMRRSLGYKLQSAGTGLLDFVTFMEHHRASYITHSLALAWAKQPSGVQPAEWARRLSHVRVFARHRSATDPRTQIPPAGLLPYRPKRAQPYIYSDEEIRDLLRAALKRPLLVGREISERDIAQREITIMADKALPYEVLKRVMATCTDADYGRISLAVIQKEKPVVAGQFKPV